MIRIERYNDPRFGQVCAIVLDRPERRNALTPAALLDLKRCALELGAEEACRAVLVRGEGPMFCSGFDLSLCKDDPGVLTSLLSGLSEVIRTLRQLGKPVVIAAHGGALAGGCALLGGADLVITHGDAKLGYPVVTLGISPAVSGPFLAKSVGIAAARSMLLDPRLISGADAGRLGLAHVVDTAEDVLPRAQIEAVKLAEKPGHAMRATKAWLNEVDGSNDAASAGAGLAASLSLVGGAEERLLLGEMLARSSKRST
ncbi:MAG: enoyl-CoA hydratase/isomerase family protein [Planctomycetota bacterium]|nr:enoyl-CoA hydratase/isomerase family protein [Planctomycetota bacterium]